MHPLVDESVVCTSKPVQIATTVYTLPAVHGSFQRIAFVLNGRRLEFDLVAGGHISVDQLTDLLNEKKTC